MAISEIFYVSEHNGMVTVPADCLHLEQSSNSFLPGLLCHYRLCHYPSQIESDNVRLASWLVETRSPHMRLPQRSPVS